MSLRKLNNRGFQPVLIVLLVLALGVGGLVGWKVLSKDKSKNVDSSSTKTSAASRENDSSAEMKTYKNETDKFMVQYPSDWSENTDIDESYPGTPSIEARLTSPSGIVVILRTDGGGFGGNCDTDEQNKCPDKTYYFKEAIKETTYHEEKRDGSKTPIYLVRSGTTNNNSGEIKYAVGLTTDPNNEIKINESQHALLMSYPFFSRVDEAGEFKDIIYAYAYCASKADFGKGDCGKAEDILRSFSFYN